MCACVCVCTCVCACVCVCVCVCVCMCVSVCVRRERTGETSIALGKMGGMEVKDGDEVVGNGRELAQWDTRIKRAYGITFSVVSVKRPKRVQCEI